MRVTIWVEGWRDDEQSHESEVAFDGYADVELETLPLVGDIVEWTHELKNGGVMFWSARVVRRMVCLPRGGSGEVGYRVEARIVDCEDVC